MKYLLAAACLLPVAAWAQSAAVSQDLALTVYNSNIALVADERQVSLRNGEQVIELPGVSSAIQPTTVTFDLGGATILEQNFDYDLLSPEKLMEKHVGQFVEIIRTNPGNGRVTTDRAKVLSVNNGVIVQVGNRIEVLRDDDIPTRVVFPDVPANLRAEPTLSIRVDGERAGTRTAGLSYLTNGMAWRSDYVANYDEAEGTLDLQGWATLTNDTDTTFDNAKVAVVAGDVQSSASSPYQQYGGGRYFPQPPRFNQGGVVRAGTQTGGAERVGDNYLYPLPGRITVRAKQTKQVGIVDATDVAADKTYAFNAYGFNTTSPQAADVTVDFTNDGTALPAGTVRVYQEDARGQSRFVGENQITHSPAGSRMSISVGKAFDVRVQPTQTDTDTIGDRVTEYEMRYRVSNASPRPITVRVVQSLPAGGYASYDIISENIPNDQKFASSITWEVEVPANGDRNLEFRLRETRR